MTLYDSYSFIERDCGRDVPEECQSGEAFDTWFGWAVAQARSISTAAHMLTERELLHMRCQVEAALSTHGHPLQCCKSVDRPNGTGFMFRGKLADEAVRAVKSDLYRSGHTAQIEVRGGMTAVVVTK